MWRAAVLALLLTGCSATIVRPNVDLPERPVLPTIDGVDMQCLSQQTHSDVVRRYVLLRQYAEQLEVVVKQLTEQ